MASTEKFPPNNVGAGLAWAKQAAIKANDVEGYVNLLLSSTAENELAECKNGNKSACKEYGRKLGEATVTDIYYDLKEFADRFNEIGDSWTDGYTRKQLTDSITEFGGPVIKESSTEESGILMRILTEDGILDTEIYHDIAEELVKRAREQAIPLAPPTL